MATVSLQDAVQRLSFRVDSAGVADTDNQIKSLQRGFADVDTAATAAGTTFASTDRALRGVGAAASVQTRAIDELRSRVAAYESGLSAATAANDNQSRSIKAANDNLADASHGLLSTASDALSLAGHLKTAAAAAYVLVPAFRSAANAAVLAVTREVIPAVAAISPATVAVGSTIISTLTPALAFMARISVPILAVVAVFKVLGTAIEDANQRIARSEELARKSIETGLSTDMIQRIEKSAKDASLSVNAMTDAFKKFKEASDDALGGSAIDKKLHELVEAGNFAANAGVAAYRGAITTEDRYRAMLQIIREAMASGQRLAALDLAGTFATPELLNRLRASADALDRIQAAANKVSQEDLIDPRQIAYAEQIKKRIEEAEAILEQKWAPFQEKLVDLGLALKNVWSVILEIIASLLEKITQIIDKITPVLPVLAALVPAGSVGGASLSRAAPDDAARRQLAAGLLQPAQIQRGMQQATEIASSVFGDTSKSKTDAKETIDYVAQFDSALKSLAGTAGDAGKELLQNLKLTEIRDQFEAARTALLAQNLPLGEYAEKLKLITTLEQASIAKVLEGEKEKSNAYTQGLQHVQDRIDEMRLEIDSVGKNKEAVTALKTARDLERTAQRAGVEADKDKVKALADQLAATERLLALKRVQEDIKFERETLFLSSDDVEIARKLKDIYPDIASSLNSAEAAQIRFNNTLKQVRDLTNDFATGFAHDFTNELRNGATAWDAFAKAGLNALNRLEDKLIDMALNNAINKAFGSVLGNGGFNSIVQPTAGTGGTPVLGANGPFVTPTFSAHGNVFDGGNIIPFARGGVIDRPVIFPMARGAGLAGEAGPEAVVPLARGADGNLGIRGGGASVNVNVTNNAGADVSVGQSRQNADGSIDIDVMLERKVNQVIGRGSAQASLGGRYGLRGGVKRR